MAKTLKTAMYAGAVALALMVLMTSCEPEKNNPPVVVDNSNGITLKFTGLLGGKDVSEISGIGHVPKSEGERMAVSNWAMILSHVALIKTNGDTVQLGDGYQYVNYLESSKNSRTVRNIPEGDYKGITFLLGLDYDVNHDDPAKWPANHPLNGFTTGLHWGWSSGYIFHALDGNYKKDSSSNTIQGFSFHTATDRYPKKITLNLNFTIGKTLKTANIRSNAEDFFANPNSIKLASGSVSHSEGTAEVALMDKVVQNIVAAFTLTAVE